jgi:hypothetical protein
MKFCEEEIKWTELIDIFQDIYNKSQQIEDVSVLQGLAIARQLKVDIQIFLDRITQIGLKSIICQVLESYDIDSGIEEVGEFIQKLFEEFNSLDDAIASIKKDDFATLEEIENAVSPIFDNFITSKEDIEKLVDDQLKILFMPLVELGASVSQIDQTLNSVNLQPNTY